MVIPDPNFPSMNELMPGQNVGAPGSTILPPTMAQQAATQAQTSRGGFQPISPTGMQRQQYDEFGNPITSPISPVRQTMTKEKGNFSSTKTVPPGVYKAMDSGVDANFAETGSKQGRTEGGSEAQRKEVEERARAKGYVPPRER